eukprot:830271-Ditylum_brightwellii.AAC.1
MGLDVTIALKPKLQTSAVDQLTESVRNLRQQEIRNDSDTPNLPAPVQPPPPVLPALAVAHIIKELLAQDMRLFLVPVNGWMVQGLAIKHLLYGNNRTTFDTTQYKFDQGVGSTISHNMCNFTMSSSYFCGILTHANKSWHQQSGMALYVVTHWECTPGSWTKHFLASRFS